LTRINPDLDPNLNLSQADMENNPILALAIAKVKRMGLSYSVFFSAPLCLIQSDPHQL